MMKISKTRTLLYYDGPVLFVGQDSVNTSYLCLLIKKTEDRDKYLCVAISPTRLNSLIVGDVDLRVVFENPEVQSYYSLDVADAAPDDLTLVILDQENLDKTWFPNPGTYLSKVPEQVKSEAIAKEAIGKKTAIIHLSLSPPESISEHVISTPLLVKGLLLFQNIVRVSFKKAIKTLPREVRTRLDIPDNYMTEVYGFSPSSFKIHLRAKTYTDLLGKADIERGLEFIDEMVSLADDLDKTLEYLKQNRGHVANYYIKLLEFIIENNSPVSYSWTSPHLKKVKSYSIYKRQALPIYEKAMAMKELGTEVIQFAGEFTKVDIERNMWTVKNDEDGKHYSGGMKEPGISLRGVTAGIQKYRFTIEERIEESEVTGKEIYSYLLVSYQKL